MSYQDHYEKALNYAQGDLKTNLLAELRNYLKVNLDDQALYKACHKLLTELTKNGKKRKLIPATQKL